MFQSVFISQHKAEMVGRYLRLSESQNPSDKQCIFVTTPKKYEKYAKQVLVLPLFAQVISKILPCLSFLKPGKAEICAPSLPLREGVLATTEEM